MLSKSNAASCHQLWANQFDHFCTRRLMFSCMAFVVSHGSDLGQTQMDTPRGLLRVAVRVENTARRVCSHLTGTLGDSQSSARLASARLSFTMNPFLMAGASRAS